MIDGGINHLSQRDLWPSGFPWIRPQGVGLLGAMIALAVFIVRRARRRRIAERDRRALRRACEGR